MSYPISLVAEIEQFINCGKDPNCSQEKTFTIANASIKRKAPDSSAGMPSGAQWAEDTPSGFVNENTGIIQAAADNTQYTRIFAWRNLRKFILDKMVVNLGFAMNASANGGNDCSFDSIDVKIYQRMNNNNQRIVQDKIGLSTGFSSMTGTNAQIYLYEESYNPNMVIEQNSAVIIDIAMNCTTGTATIQQGMLQGFPLAKSNATKQWSMPGIYLLGRSVQN